MRPRKPTFMDRATVAQEIRQVIGPEPDAPEGSYRVVQLIVPNSPGVLFSIDHPTSAEAGPDRTYKMAEMSPGAQIQFSLQPHQTVHGAAQDGQAFASVIIEYFDGDDD